MKVKHFNSRSVITERLLSLIEGTSNSPVGINRVFVGTANAPVGPKRRVCVLQTPVLYQQNGLSRQRKDCINKHTIYHG